MNSAGKPQPKSRSSIMTARASSSRPPMMNASAMARGRVFQKGLSSFTSRPTFNASIAAENPPEAAQSVPRMPNDRKALRDHIRQNSAHQAHAVWRDEEHLLGPRLIQTDLERASRQLPLRGISAQEKGRVRSSRSGRHLHRKVAAYIRIRADERGFDQACPHIVHSG